MRLLPAIAVFLAAFLAAFPTVAAPVFDSPEALIDYAYRPYADGAFPEDPFELYSPGLRQLVDAAIAKADDEVVAGLDFDPFIDAQDYENLRVDIGAVDVSADRAEAEVTVHNFDVTAKIAFFLTKTDKGWLIDDIARTDGDYPWRLSELLADDMALN